MANSLLVLQPLVFHLHTQHIQSLLTSLLLITSSLLFYTRVHNAIFIICHVHKYRLNSFLVVFPSFVCNFWALVFVLPDLLSLQNCAHSEQLPAFALFSTKTATANQPVLQTMESKNTLRSLDTSPVVSCCQEYSR